MWRLLQAELVHLRAEVADARAVRLALEEQLHLLLLKLHAAQLQLPGGVGGVSAGAEADAMRVLRRVQEELQQSPRSGPALGAAAAAGVAAGAAAATTTISHIARLEGQRDTLERENAALRNTLLALHSEVRDTSSR